MAQAISLNLSLRWPEIKDDYLVRFQSHTIGHVRRADGGWEWAITIPMAMPDWATGRAANLEECVKALANSWSRFLKQTDPERLQRAWDLEKAAEARGSTK